MKELHIWLRLPAPDDLPTQLLYLSGEDRLLGACQERVDTVHARFCSTRWLAEGYQLFIHLADGTDTEIRLGSKNGATGRCIRLEHNLERLLLAGEFGPVETEPFGLSCRDIKAEQIR